MGAQDRRALSARRWRTQWRNGRGHSQIRLLAIGDSIIAGVGAKTLEKALVGRTAERLAQTAGARVVWTAKGKNGVTSRYIARRLLPRVADKAENSPFDAILVSAGVNDVISLHSLGRWRRDIDALLTALAGRWPEAVIAMSGLPPMNHFPTLPQPLRAVFGMRARDFDRTLREILQRYRKPPTSHLISKPGQAASATTDSTHRNALTPSSARWPPMPYSRRFPTSSPTNNQ